MQLVTRSDNHSSLCIFTLRISWLIPLILISFFLCKKSDADLISSPISELVDKSDVILFANPVSFKTTDSHGSGYAVFDVSKIIKGNILPTFQVAWSSEVHDQKIERKKLRLLFLRRKADGEYTGTYYGRSYWEVEKNVKENIVCQQYAKYSYPVNTIDIDLGYVDARFFMKNILSEKGKDTSILCLDKLQFFFRNQGGLK